MTHSRLPRVCMVAERFHPYIGGSETQALFLSEALQKIGVELFVLTRRIPPQTPRVGQVRGMRVFRLSPSGTGKLSLMCAAASFAFFLVRRRNSYEILHCHGLGWIGPLSSLLGLLLGKKVVVKVATAGDVSGKIVGKWTLPPFVNDIRLYLLRKATRVVCISREIADELRVKGFPDGMLARVPNGVDVGTFHPGDGSRQLLPPGEISIVFSGRIVYRKGLDVLVQAFGRLIADGFRVRLHVFGSSKFQAGDEYEEEIRSYVTASGVEDSVVFHGNVENIADYLREADIFAFPSRSEGLPNALLEAMACALPVVATAIGGIVDVVEDGGNGLLVESEEPHQMYEALRKLVESPDLRRELGKKAIETIRAEYAIDAIALQYKKLYEELNRGA